MYYCNHISYIPVVAPYLKLTTCSSTMTNRTSGQDHVFPAMGTIVLSKLINVRKPEGQSRINNPETQDKQQTQETGKKIDKSNIKPRKLKNKMGKTNPVNMICRSIRCQTNLYHIYVEVLHNTVNQLSLIVSFYLKNEKSFTVVLIRSRKFVHLDTCHTSLINENMEHF